MTVKVNVTIDDWRMLNLENVDNVESYLMFMLETAGRVMDTSEKEDLLVEIDALHHYLERVYGRDDHTLAAFLSNYDYIYETLETKKWRLSYLFDEVPYNVNKVIKTALQSDGNEVFYSTVQQETDASSSFTEEA